MHSCICLFYLFLFVSWGTYGSRILNGLSAEPIPATFHHLSECQPGDGVWGPGRSSTLCLNGYHSTISCVNPEKLKLKTEISLKLRLA
jgi:hypothetical protein